MDRPVYLYNASLPAVFGFRNLTRLLGLFRTCLVGIYRSCLLSLGAAVATVLYCIGKHTEEVTDSIQVGQFVSKLFSTKLLLLFGGPAALVSRRNIRLRK